MAKVHVIETDMTVFCDVDDTLVLWDSKNPNMEIKGIPVEIHHVHVEKLKQFAARGHFIVVWSAGGYEWAANVVKLLGLEETVDLVIAKPRWFFDDLRAEEFMPEVNRIYMPVGEVK
jgi:hypothetical protein